MINLFKKLFSRQTPTCQHNDCDIELYDDLYPSHEVKNYVFDENNIDLGHGFAARKLLNGKWVIWNCLTCKAIDMTYYSYSWTPGATYWKCCYCDTLDEIKLRINDVKSFYGVLASDDTII